VLMEVQTLLKQTNFSFQPYINLMDFYNVFLKEFVKGPLDSSAIV
jgi:hypothetical protein